MHKPTVKQYTLEVYRKDGRTRTGYRLIETRDLPPLTAAEVDSVVEKFQAPGITTVLNETWVTRKNLISGREFRERYDTPRYCSPSSESYWSM